MERKMVYGISKNDCYQFICGGTSKWPGLADHASLQDMKQTTTNFCIS